MKDRARATARPESDAVLPLLAAAVLVPTLELLRASGPLLDAVAGTTGIVGAAGVAVLLHLAPALAGAAAAVLGAARATVAAVVALVLLRLAAQVPAVPPFPLVAAGAAVGLAALVLVVWRCVRAGSGVAALTGLLLGGVVDAALRTAWRTWDPVWRPGASAWLLTVLTCGAVVAALALARSRLGRVPHPVFAAGRFWGLGPYLALLAMTFGSASFVASQSGVRLEWAGAVLITGGLVALEVVRRMRLPGGTGAIPEPDTAYNGVLPTAGLVAGLAAGYWLAGPVVLAGVVLAQVSAAVLLARALTPATPVSATVATDAAGGSGTADAAGPGAVGEPAGTAGAVGRRRDLLVGLAVAGAATGLGYVLPVLLFQVHYDLAFPFDNRLVPLAAAVVLGLAGLGRRPGGRRAGPRALLDRPAPLTLAAVPLLLVPLLVAVTGPAVSTAEPDRAAVRLMTWNVKYGRHDATGAADPESVAVAIEEQAPDVVLLQEVSRGWPIGGGVDLAEWLSRRLGMPYHWSPAADGQFGNLLLTRLPVADVVAARLPYGQGPQHRSYLAATVRLGGGRELRLVNAHLQHRKENTPTRLAQIDVLLGEWDGAPHTVVAGDFNFWPTWVEAQRFHDAGLVSAQDVTGHGARFTSPTDRPTNRVDWIFGTPDLRFDDFAVLDDVRNSDHFPLVVTVHLT